MWTAIDYNQLEDHLDVEQLRPHTQQCGVANIPGTSHMTLSLKSFVSTSVQCLPQ